MANSQNLGTQQDFGTDISCVPDLDPAFAVMSGNRVLVETLLRRWTTPRGAEPSAPNAGTDIRDFLNESMTSPAGSGLSGPTGQMTLQRVKNAMENEAKGDQRVRNCSVNLTFNAGSGQLTANVSVDAGAGPYTLELAISAVTITLLRIG